MSMTAEGGLFNEQMQKQSETLFGLASTVKDNLFLAFADLGNQIEETFEVKQSMKDFIVWLGALVAEMKKPAEEQQGFARTITASLVSIKGIFNTVGAAMGAIGDFFNNTPLGQQIHGHCRLGRGARIGVRGVGSLHGERAAYGNRRPDCDPDGAAGDHRFDRRRWRRALRELGPRKRTHGEAP